MFAGYLSNSPKSGLSSCVDQYNWGRMLSESFTAQSSECWQQRGAMLVRGQMSEPPSMGLHQSTTEVHADATENRLGVAFWGRLDNRSDLCEELFPNGVARSEPTDIDLIAEGWRRWGKTLPQHLLGDFCLAIVDPQVRQVFLARDPLGVKPLYYWQHPEGLLFGTTAKAFLCLKGLTPTKDRDWMAQYLCNQSMSPNRTGFEEIQKLPGGHQLTVDGNGQQQLHRWHHWQDDAPVSSHRDPKWLEIYREKLEEAIRCRMISGVSQDHPDYRLGTENSGGIDSATITAYLAKFLGQPGDRLHSFGFATQEEEAAHILATSRQSKLRHNYIVTSTDSGSFEEETRHTLDVLGYPEEHPNGSGHTTFYQECKTRGIDILFSGFGGDEVVTNYGTHIHKELLDGGQYAGVWNILRGNSVTRPLRMAKMLAFGVDDAKYNSRMLVGQKRRWAYNVLRPEFVQRLGLYDSMVKKARYATPYRRNNDWLINGMLQMSYIPTRLENCTLMAAAYGIDYRWPLWDVRLVQQYLSTPSIEKIGPSGIARYLHRRAITGTVPDLVAWKKSKCMMGSAEPNAVISSRFSRLTETAQRAESDLHTDVAEFIDREKWRQQIQQAKEGKGTIEFKIQFNKTTQAIQTLNVWINDDKAARCAA